MQQRLVKRHCIEPLREFGQHFHTERNHQGLGTKSSMLERKSAVQTAKSGAEIDSAACFATTIEPPLNRRLLMHQSGVGQAATAVSV